MDEKKWIIVQEQEKYKKSLREVTNIFYMEPIWQDENQTEGTTLVEHVRTM